MRLKYFGHLPTYRRHSLGELDPVRLSSIHNVTAPDAIELVGDKILGPPIEAPLVMIIRHGVSKGRLPSSVTCQKANK